MLKREDGNYLRPDNRAKSRSDPDKIEKGGSSAYHASIMSTETAQIACATDLPHPDGNYRASERLSDMFELATKHV